MNYSRLYWFYNRLKAMSTEEIIWRFSQKLSEKQEYRKFKYKRLITETDLFKDVSALPMEIAVLNKFYCLYNDNFKNLYKGVFCEHYEEAIEIAESIYGKRINIIGGRTQQFDANINWFAGINTQNSWPFEFSHDIDFRQTDGIGDVRFIWDLNRHYHLVILSKAYYLTDDKKYLEELKNQFYNWVEKNPFLYGVNWASTMEIAIRAFSWLWCLILLCSIDYKNNKKFIEDIHISIINSITYVTRHFSLYSSANNHLIVEAAISGIVGTVFSNSYWIEQSLKILQREVKLQISEDGVNKEQALHYQTFVMEVLALYIVLLKKNSIEYPNIIYKKIMKMSEFISNVMNTRFRVPNIGDSDEGCILNVTGNHYNHYEYVLQLTSLIDDKQYIKINNINENLIWLFGENVLKNGFTSVYNNEKSKVYTEGGYSILKYRDEEKERILTFDHGELGYGSIAAHGHADLLSITLSVDSQDIFIDPGTYIYNIEKRWRDYFRKTINHNTVEINHEDQSEIKGAFLWGKKPKATINNYLITEKYDSVSAMHNGYDNIIHKRNVFYVKPDLFIIKDEILGDTAEYVLTYMIDSNIDVIKVNDDATVLQWDKNIIRMFFYGADSIAIDNEYSSEFFGRKNEIKAVRAYGKAKNKEILTFICINNELDITENSGNLTFKYNNLLYLIEDTCLTVIGEEK